MVSTYCKAPSHSQGVGWCMSSNCFKITNINVKTETLQTLSDKNYGKICYSDNSFLCPALSLPALTMSWKEDRHLHHTSSWVQKNAVKIDQHLHHTFCSVHSNAVKKKTETCITPFDVFTIVLWKKTEFQIALFYLFTVMLSKKDWHLHHTFFDVFTTQCFEKRSDTSIKPSVVFTTRFSIKDRHFHHTFWSFHSNIVKKRQTLASHFLMCSQGECERKTDACIPPIDVFSTMLWKKDRHFEHNFWCVCNTE